jgi:hypothetical protein
MFSEEYPKPLVANMIDVAARDLGRGNGTTASI